MQYRMKKMHIIIPMAAMVVGVVISTGCSKDRLDKLSSTDLAAYEGIEASYNSAKLYNDSLVSCGGSGGVCTDAFINYCDSLFHHYEEEWSHHHGDYDHDNKHCDHHHNSDGMHQQGNRHNHDNDEGHHEYHHGLMDNLLKAHQPYHP